jgi:signal transduction histidine kinase
MNDLLDLGKPISAANFQVVSLMELCQKTVVLWKETGMAKNRHVVVSTGQDAADLLVTADYSKLQQAIFNLLENAGHHSSADNSIIMRLAGSTSSQDMAIVQISDSGKGIPEERLSRVFEPFYSDRKEGTGLGLSLVKHFIENMGGSVRISNNNPLPGCTAELCIPLAVKEHE